MAIYPVKMLKDENGQPFVPITHISAVSGEEYTIAVLLAEKQSAGHYKITNSELSNTVLTNRVVAIKFDDITGATSPSYLQINSDTEYALYSTDGTNYLRLNDFEDSIIYISLVNQKWQMVSVGASGGSSTGGHIIEDSSGTEMTARQVLKFKNLDVSDDSTNGLTLVKNNNWMKPVITGTTGTITSSTWTNLTSSAITITEGGTYEITVYVELATINYVGKEVAVRIESDGEKWGYQYKHFRQDFTFVKTFSANDTFTPQIYIDPLTSTAANTLSACKIFIKRIEVNNS